MEKYHNCFLLKEKETNQVLTDLEEIHFIEFPKLDEGKYQNQDDIDNKLIPWLLFLKNPKSEVVKMIEERIKELKEAAETLEVLSHDEETRELYKARQKAIHDHISNIEGARREERRRLAKKLLDILDIETIAEKTGLSIEEVKKLKEEI